MGHLVQPGETFGDVVELTPESVKTFTTLARDLNPLHLDEAYAAQSRFGGLIASGTQPMAYFSALLATHYSKTAQPLGLEFHMKLKKAALATDTLHMQWRVVSADWKAKLGGDIVKLAGEVRNTAGEVLVHGEATILVCPKLAPADT